MNKYKTLASNTAFISAGVLGSKLLMFLMVRFYTGCLTPADYSTADLLTQTAILLTPLVSLGITDGVFRFAAGRREGEEEVFTAGLCVVSGGCLLLALILPLLCLVPAISQYVWLVAVYIASSCLHSLCAQFIRAVGKTKLFAVQGLINTALMVVLNIVFLAVMELGVTGYMLSVVIANLLSAVFMTAAGRLWTKLCFPPKRETAAAMLKYSVPLIPASIFWWVTSVSDRYMVAGFIGSEANGVYSVAYKIPTILTIISSIFMDAWQISAVSEAQNDRRAHIRFYSNVWSAFQSAMFLCGAGIIAFSQAEIGLLSTEEYYSAWQYVPLLAMAMVFASFSNFLGSVYIVTKKSSLSFRTSMIGAAINVALNLVLIPSPLGVQGAAAATFASYFVVFVIRLVSVRKLIPFRPYVGKLAINLCLMTVQTAFMVFQLPLWKLVQGAALLLALLLNGAPLLAGAKKLGFPRLIGRGNT